jgi:alpha-galactosidase
MALMAQAAPMAGPFQLSTADTTLTVEARDDGVYVTQLGVGGREANWLSAPSREPFLPQVWVDEKPFDAAWRFREARHESAEQCVFVFENENPKLQLRSIWQARPGHGPVRHWIEIENQSPQRVALAQQDSLTIEGLRAKASARLWWIQRGGGNASVQGGTHCDPVNAETDLNLVSNCEDGASPSPWMAVQCGDDEGLYVGWEFSGLGRIRAKAAETGDLLTIAAGNLPDFKTDIAPGEVFLVPPAFVGCYAGDIDQGAYTLHTWFLKYLRPPVPQDIQDPTLAYNLYLDAGGPEAREADVLRSAACCRDLGFETFMPDAMWFPACGDWRWDPARFPNGVKPIEEFVHQSGMKLALWCAWNNGGVAEAPGALSVRGPVGKPDWFRADYAADWQPGPFYGGQVCLACPEAKAWLMQKTQWLVSEHKLDYLKHDCGQIVTSCNKTTHRHHYGTDASYWAAMGYYEVQEQLRQKFPRLLLENCSGGGHIKDYGAMRRTHYTVTTDTLSNLPDRQSIYDSTFAFPPLVLQAYTYEWFYKAPGDDPGPFLWRSAMMGAWQIDPTGTLRWTPEQRASAQRDARIYKEWIRPMLKDVKAHHILPRPDGAHWDGMF